MILFLNSIVPLKCPKKVFVLSHKGVFEGDSILHRKQFIHCYLEDHIFMDKIMNNTDLKLTVSLEGDCSVSFKL